MTDKNIKFYIALVEHKGDCWKAGDSTGCAGRCVTCKTGSRGNCSDENASSGAAKYLIEQADNGEEF